MKTIRNYLSKILIFLGRKPEQVEYRFDPEPYKRCNIGSTNRKTKLKLTEDDISSILQSDKKHKILISSIDMENRHPEYIAGYFIFLPCAKKHWVEMFVSDQKSVHLFKAVEVYGDFPSYPDEELVEQLNFVMVQLKKNTQHDFGKKITGSILLFNASTRQYVEYGDFTFDKARYNRTLKRLREERKSKLDEVDAA